jgi:hypothetical protein
MLIHAKAHNLEIHVLIIYSKAREYNNNDKSNAWGLHKKDAVATWNHEQPSQH